jgi:hypothetical protein
MRKSLFAAFDCQAYFDASPRAIAVDAIRALNGDALANRSGKPKMTALVLCAAMTAGDRHRLSLDFVNALTASDQLQIKDERSAAPAMRDAIVEDEAQASRRRRYGRTRHQSR